MTWKDGEKEGGRGAIDETKEENREREGESSFENFVSCYRGLELTTPNVVNRNSYFNFAYEAQEQQRAVETVKQTQNSYP